VTMVTRHRGRREDERLVTGRGRFTADHAFEDETHGHFVRSDRAHALLRSIEIGTASAMPGVRLILLAADMERAGVRPAPPTPAPAGAGTMLIRSPASGVFASAKVTYVGQPIALVVAATARLAQDAAETVAVNYQELPAVVDVATAMRPDAPLVDADIPGNLCFDYEYGDREATAAAFDGAAHVTRVRLESQRLIGNPLEPKACIARYDAQTGCFDIHCPHQGLSMIRDQFALGMGVSPDRIRIHANDVGGGFGVRIEAYREYLALAEAARRLGQPVKWIGSRSETMVSDFHGRGVVLFGELALAADGRFLAIRHRWLVDAGAHPSMSGALVTTLAPSAYLVGPYRTPLIHGRHQVVLTNTVPTTPYRGSARPSVAYVIERLVDQAAKEMGIDRIDLRRFNLLSRSAFPYRTPVGSLYDSGDWPAAGLVDTEIRFSNPIGGFHAAPGIQP